MRKTQCERARPGLRRSSHGPPDHLECRPYYRAPRRDDGRSSRMVADEIASNEAQCVDPSRIVERCAGNMRQINRVAVTAQPPERRKQGWSDRPQKRAIRTTPAKKPDQADLERGKPDAPADDEQAHLVDDQARTRSSRRGRCSGSSGGNRAPRMTRICAARKCGNDHPGAIAGQYWPCQSSGKRAEFAFLNDTQHSTLPKPASARIQANNSHATVVVGGCQQSPHAAFNQVLDVARFLLKPPARVALDPLPRFDCWCTRAAAASPMEI